MLGIVEVLRNVLVWISQVAALNWSDTIYSLLGYHRKKTPKIDMFARKVIFKSLSNLDNSDVPETYVDNLLV